MKSFFNQRLMIKSNLINHVIPKFVIVKCMLLIKKLFFLLDVTKRQVNGVNEKNYTACA